MSLTGPQAKQIQDVLLAAFDRAELAQMVQFQLGEILDQIAGGTDLTEIVFNLVQWADRNGRLLNLIDGALAANPDNPQLQELAARGRRLASGPSRRRRPALPGSPILRRGRRRPLLRARGADRRTGRLPARPSLPGRHRRIGQRQVVPGARRALMPALPAGRALPDRTCRPKAAHWPVHIVTPTAHPLKALAASLTKGSESVTAQATLMDDMRKDAAQPGPLWSSRVDRPTRPATACCWWWTSSRNSSPSAATAMSAGLRGQPAHCRPRMAA